MVEKPNRRKVLLGTGAALGALSGCMGSTQENGESGDRELVWGEQQSDRGAENAELNCDEYGYWHWVLTPGGSESIDVESAELEVRFSDGTSVTVEGYRPSGGDQGAVHFDVYKEGGGEVDEAIATFSGGGENAGLTISDSECVQEDDVPDDSPLPGDGDNGNGDDGNGDNGDDNGGGDNDDGDNGDGDDNDGDDGDGGDDDGDDSDGDDDDEKDGDGEKKTKKPPAVDVYGRCYKDDKGKGQFRVENHEAEAVTVTWNVLGTARSGTVSIPKNGSETVWVTLETDQKLALYDGEIRIAAAKVNTADC